MSQTSSCGGVALSKSPEFDDPVLGTIYRILLARQLSSQRFATCERCFDVTDWMEDNMTGASLSDLWRYPDMLQNVEIELTAASLESLSVRPAMEAHEILSLLEECMPCPI